MLYPAELGARLRNRRRQILARGGEGQAALHSHHKQAPGPELPSSLLTALDRLRERGNSAVLGTETAPMGH